MTFAILSLFIAPFCCFQGIRTRFSQPPQPSSHKGVKGVLTTNAANTLICGGGSGDMAVAADGTYDFYFYPAELTLYVMEAGVTPTR